MAVWGDQLVPETKQSRAAPGARKSVVVATFKRSMSSSGHVWADDKADVQRNVDKTLKYSGNLI